MHFKTVQYYISSALFSGFRPKAPGHRPHPWCLHQPTETSIGPNIKCPVTLMKYFSCDKWGRHQSWKVLKTLIDQRNGVITPLTFLTVDSCFHGLSISPHQAVQLTSSYCVHSLTSVLWLPVTKRVLGWERDVFCVLECTVRQSTSGRRLAVRPWTLNCGWHRSRRNSLEVGRGVQIHACFIAWTEWGEEHKWHWGEEVRNIILKCTDKSACASTDKAASNTWCFL